MQLVYSRKKLVDYGASFLLKHIVWISDVIAWWIVQIPNKMSAYKLHNRTKRLLFFFSFLYFIFLGGTKSQK